MRNYDEFIKEASVFSKLKDRRRALRSPEYRAASDEFCAAATEFDAAFAERKTNPERFDRAAVALNQADEKMRSILGHTPNRTLQALSTLKRSK